QAHKTFAASQARARGIARVPAYVRLQLENGEQTAAQAFLATKAEARGVASDPNNGRIVAGWNAVLGVTGLRAPNEFQVQVRASVERHVRGLRLRGQRQRKGAGDGN